MSSAPDMLRHQRRRPALLLAMMLVMLIVALVLILIMVGAATEDSLLSWRITDDRAPVASPAAGTQANAAPPMVAPPSDLTALKPVSAPEAERANAAIPFSTAPNPVARAFQAAGTDIETWRRSVSCLTAAAYYEAASEGHAGMSAVAQVVLNRVRHPAFPHSVCGVVFQGAERHTGCQFSFTCDGSMARRPVKRLWIQARSAAVAALGGAIYAPVGLATHYHTRWALPYWAYTLDKNAVVGNHIFYRWGDTWGRPSAFGQPYVRLEPDLPWIGALAPTQDSKEADADADGQAHTADSPVVTSGPREVIGTVAPVIHATAPHLVKRDERWRLGTAPTGGETTAPPAPSSTRTTAPARPD